MDKSLDELYGKIIKPFGGFQEAFTTSQVDVVWGVGQLGSGKLQPLDSKVLTPSGFVEMRDIKVGSEVVTPFDGIANVTAIFPQGIKDVYEFVLSDGRKCECGLEHLWTVFTEYPKSVCPRNEIEGSITVQTKYLIENMAKGKTYYVPNAILEDNKYPFSYTRNEIATRIEYIKKVRRAECQCILVDDDKHLYITDDFIVTHTSYALVLAMAQALMTDSDFRGLISRKAIQSLKAGGGFVEKFKQIFGEYCSVRESDNPRISFPIGSFCDLTYIDDSDMVKLRERAKGWEYDVIAVDEITEMSFECFTYLMTRNRGNSKTFTGHMFATLNPKRSHWSRVFLDWYIGPDGYVNHKRVGRVRFFYLNGTTVEDVVWGDTKEEVYYKCKYDIDRKLKSVGGRFKWYNMIKSFVFYEGRMSENETLNENYIGSAVASGGKTAQSLVEANFNVDPEEEENIPISGNSARRTFTEDPKVNGDKWITVDLADVGDNNLVALAWDGFHIFDIMILMKSKPKENADKVRIFAQNNKIAYTHIIFDGTSARYFNDFIPEAICYVSSRKSFGIYENQAPTVKDMCYLRLSKLIKEGILSWDENVAKAPYIRSDLHHSITVQTEFLEECSVLRFREQQNGSMKLWGKKEMNARLGKNRSMDLLDPIAMRMLPCANIPYGDELESGFADAKNAEDDYYEQNNNAETVNIYDEHTWY